MSTIINMTKHNLFYEPKKPVHSDQCDLMITFMCYVDMDRYTIEGFEKGGVYFDRYNKVIPACDIIEVNKKCSN